MTLHKAVFIAASIQHAAFAGYVEYAIGSAGQLRREAPTSEPEAPRAPPPTSAHQCPSNSFPGKELQIARKAWSGKELQGITGNKDFRIPVDSSTVVYAVRKGKLYRSHEQGEHRELPKGFASDDVFILSLLWRTIRRFSADVPDADLILSYGDTETTTARELNMPIFTFSPPRSSRAASAGETTQPIGFPSPYLLNDALTLQERGQQVKNVTWHKKKSQCYWRGTLTGPEKLDSKEEFLQQARPRLAEIANANPSKYDVAWTDIDEKPDWGEGARNESARIYQSRPHADAVDFYEVLPDYKCLPNVDGVSASWRGLPLLAAGSNMFLPVSKRGEFFFEDLRAWVHYVPIKSDLSDLQSTTEYLHRYDYVGSRIGAAGRKFALANLTFPALECYCLDALQFMATTSGPMASVSDLLARGFELAPEPNKHLELAPEPNKQLQT